MHAIMLNKTSHASTSCCLNKIKNIKKTQLQRLMQEQEEIIQDTVPGDTQLKGHKQT